VAGHRGGAGKMKTQSKEKGHQIRNFSCGLVSGLVQAVVFNPWDRALYLSVKESRPFRSIQNFQQPFSGLLQTIFQRAISAGLYFPLEQYFIEFFSQKISDHSNNSHWIALAAGNCAGAVNGLALNPLAAIKVNTRSCFPSYLPLLLICLVVPHLGH
jgi:hypothetical protein